MFKLFTFSAPVHSLAAVALADHGKGAVGGKTVPPRRLHEEDFSLEMGFRCPKSETFTGQQRLFAVRGEVQLPGLGTFPRLNGSAELSELLAALDKKGPSKNQDSGGSIVGLGLGPRVGADEHMPVGATVTHPVNQGLNGEQPKERYEFLFGTAYDF